MRMVNWVVCQVDGDSQAQEKEVQRNEWDDDEDHWCDPDCHTSRLRWHMYSPKSIFSAEERGVC